MYKITKIATDDGKEFDTLIQAEKHLENQYANKLMRLAARAVDNHKHVSMCKFIDENLEYFTELFILKNEIKTGLNEKEDME